MSCLWNLGLRLFLQLFSKSTVTMWLHASVGHCAKQLSGLELTFPELLLAGRFKSAGPNHTLLFRLDASFALFVPLVFNLVWKPQRFLFRLVQLRGSVALCSTKSEIDTEIKSTVQQLPCCLPQPETTGMSLLHREKAECNAAWSQWVLLGEVCEAPGWFWEQGVW